jgi:hypothetical protein
MTGWIKEGPESVGSGGFLVSFWPVKKNTGLA